MTVSVNLHVVESKGATYRDRRDEQYGRQDPRQATEQQRDLPSVPERFGPPIERQYCEERLEISSSSKLVGRWGRTFIEIPNRAAACAVGVAASSSAAATTRISKSGYYCLPTVIAPCTRHSAVEGRPLCRFGVKKSSAWTQPVRQATATSDLTVGCRTIPGACCSVTNSSMHSTEPVISVV